MYLCALKFKWTKNGQKIRSHASVLPIVRLCFLPARRVERVHLRRILRRVAALLHHPADGHLLRSALRRFGRVPHQQDSGGNLHGEGLADGLCRFDGHHHRGQQRQHDQALQHLPQLANPRRRADCGREHPQGAGDAHGRHQRDPQGHEKDAGHRRTARTPSASSPCSTWTS